MEERILDKDESRGIRLKRTAEGETDAVEGADGASEEEVTLTLPDEEYDEDLVGLTPSQLKEELEKREKARQEAIRECKRLTEEGNAHLAAGDFAAAENAFGQAVVYDGEDPDAALGYFAAVTQNFTVTEPLYTEEHAQELARLTVGHAPLLEKMGGALRAERDAYKQEADELRPIEEEKRSVRRAAFAANRNHYTIFTCVSLFLTAIFAVVTAISFDNILRTQSNLPLILSIVFGVLTFLALTVTAVFGVKLFGAVRLCAKNEKENATSDGKRLLLLKERLETLSVLFPEDEE